MPTNSAMFEVIHNWTVWNGADYGARLADAEGRHTTAADHRAFRDQRTVDPLMVLSATRA